MERESTSEPSIVIGYGALMHREYVAALCGEGLLDFAPGLLRGYRRHFGLHYRNGCWDAGAFALPNQERYVGGVAYLDLRKSPGTEFRVSIVTVNQAGLTAIDASEYLYRRVQVPAQECVGMASPSNQVAGPHFLYFGDPSSDPNGAYSGSDVVISEAYLARVLNGARELGPDSEAEFWRTTDCCSLDVVPLIWRDT